MDPKAGEPKSERVEREPMVHEVRQGDQVRVVIVDPESGEEEVCVGLAVIFKPDDSPLPIAVPMGGGISVERLVSEAMTGLIVRREAFMEMMQQRQMLMMQQQTGLMVPGGPGVQTPGGVFMPGPPPGRRGRKKH